MKVHPIDLAVIAAYLGLMVAIGARFGKKSRQSTDRYFFGGRNFPGWAIGLSFIGSTISSVTFIAFPADSFKTAWVRLLPNFAFPLIALAAAYFLVPFFRRAGIRSAYDYLALRFGPSVAVYAALVYIIAQVVRLATVTYLLAVLVSSLTGMHIGWCIIVAGGVTAAYTFKGGFEAVVWTDVIQTIVLLTGALICIFVILAALPGGLAAVLREAFAAQKLSFFDLNTATGRLEPIHWGFSLSEKTVLMLMLTGVSQYVTAQLDQHSVQRWCSARSTTEARKSMVILGFGALPIWAMFMFLGTCLWVYFRHFPSPVSAAILTGAHKAEDILPSFIVSVLPPGISGLVISAALAGAMASLSSSISAAGMVWVNDVYRLYWRREQSDAHYLVVARMTTLILAGLMMAGAYLFYFSAALTIVETSIIATALIGGGISGAFLFGMLTRQGDARSVMVGVIATMIFSVYALLMQFGWLPRSFNPYYTSILGNLLMFGMSWLAAACLPVQGRNLEGLTLWRPFPLAPAASSELGADRSNIARSI